MIHLQDTPEINIQASAQNFYFNNLCIKTEIIWKHQEQAVN